MVTVPTRGETNKSEFEYSVQYSNIQKRGFLGQTFGFPNKTIKTLPGMPLLFPADAGVCEDPPSEAALHGTSVSLSMSDFAEWIEERAGVTLARRLNTLSPIFLPAP